MKTLASQKQQAHGSMRQVRRILCELSRVALVAVLGTLALGPERTLRAAEIDATWIGGTGLWNNPRNWDINHVPDNDQDNTYHVLIDGGSPTNSYVTTSNHSIDKLTIDANDTLEIGYRADLTVNGGPIWNSGTITFEGHIMGRLYVSGGDVELTGTGSGTVDLVTEGPYRSAISGVTSKDRLVNVNNTIRGSGTISGNDMGFWNQGEGVVNANLADGIIIDPGTSGVINQGTMQASSGGTLRLYGSGTFDNTGGTIEALDYSLVDISNKAIVKGGTVRVVQAGELRLRECRIEGSAQNSGSGTIRATEIASTITGDLPNPAGGHVVVDTSLTVSGMIGNSGQLYLEGGAIDGGDVMNDGTTNGYGIIASDFVNNGTVAASTFSPYLTFRGAVSGSGSFTGKVIFEGTYTPGESPAVVSFEDVAFAQSATLEMEIGGLLPGTEHDQINATGAVELGGTLNVVLLPSYTPADGHVFDLLDWESLSGTFDTLNLPGLPGGLAWDTSDLYNTGSVSMIPEPVTLSLLGIGGLALIRRKRT